MNIINLLQRASALGVLLLAASALFAQTTEFFVEDVTARVDEEISVNVRGSGLEDIVGLQLSLSWDTLTLDYVGITNIALEGTPEDNFNLTQLDSGRVGYLEVDNSLRGFGLPDSSLLFTLRFRSATTVSTETDIVWGEAPLRRTVSDANNNSVTPELRPGTVNLEGSNSLSTFAEDPRFTVMPNPMSDHGQIRVTLNYRSSATLEVLDVAGKTLLRQPWSLHPGGNTLPLTSASFPADGSYIVRLITDREQLHRKVIFRRQGR
ncbi:MAG: T9SS type A sorting domain-containing protein [Bacteroidota bacterium]